MLRVNDARGRQEHSIHCDSATANAPKLDLAYRGCCRSTSLWVKSLSSAALELRLEDYR
jgi:hypothetical protein